MLILDEADRMLDMGFIHDLQADRRPRAATAADAAVLGHDAAGNSPAGRRVAARSGRRAASPRRPPPADTCRAVGLFRREAAQAAPAGALPAASSRHQPHAGLHPHQARRRQARASTCMQAGIRAEAIHGNKSQTARQRALAQFKSQQPPVLVATDIAARGLDIDDVSHVVNYDLPHDAGDLRAPHRPHGPGRRRRHRRVVLRPRGTSVAPQHRTAHTAASECAAQCAAGWGSALESSGSDAQGAVLQRPTAAGRFAGMHDRPNSAGDFRASNPPFCLGQRTAQRDPCELPGFLQAPPGSSPNITYFRLAGRAVRLTV